MNLPSLIVLGSQTEWPSTQFLVHLRALLLSDPRLEKFLTAIRELPHLWERLLKSSPNLKKVPGLEAIDHLLQWIEHGEFSWMSDLPPNVLSTPLTIIIHIVHYFDFLKTEGNIITHADIIKNVKSAGIQGYCTGFLSAVALACSRNEEDASSLGAVALRLAFCIGAFVDLDGAFADPPNETLMIAVRWKSDNGKDTLLNILQDFPNAYVSVVSHSTGVTVTTPKSSAASLAHELSAQGLAAKPTRLGGRFHSHIHSHAVEIIRRLAESNSDLKFPTIDELLVPLRCNSNGQVISEGSLLEIALNSIMTQTSNWHLTITAATSQLNGLEVPRVMVAGLADPIPASITRELKLRVLRLCGSNVSSLMPTPRAATPSIPHRERRYPDHAVAIVGMACKFPGADSIDEFWDVIQTGKSMVQEVPAERFSTKNLRRTGAEKTQLWGNFVRDVDAFDHRFFKKSSREAVSTDPQQRLVLQCAYEAMESAGYFGEVSKTQDDDTGCFLGICASDYNDNVASHPPTAFSSLGTLRAFLSGKISHYFGWSGPSITFDTACSSSLVAIHQACNSIQLGECSRAVAGGANVFTNPNFYQNLIAGGFLSPSGATKAFDAKADGYCRGEGIGLVVLKKLSRAIADGDNILAVVAGSAVNQNSNASAITVPHSPSQASLYSKVSSLSGIDPMDISFVEAHGTGTPVGDPIECESIRQVFGGVKRDKKLYVGSVKGNIGHTEAASGVAALIKAVLMLQKGTIPLQANFTSLNPKIKWVDSDRMEIPTTSMPWNSDFRAMCINNYGASGSNAAMIVCQPPETSSRQNHPLPKYPIFISAFSHASLVAYCSALQRQLPSVSSLADLAFNLADKQNRSLPHALVATTTSLAELNEQLGACSSIQLPAQTKPVVLCFGGQSTNTVTLCKSVYYSSALLRFHLDHCDSLLRSVGLTSLFPDIFQAEPIDDVVSLHCRLFSLQYSCAKSWMQSGLRVDTMIGHSFGQLTALCVAGYLSLEDGLRLVSGRAALMQRCWGPDKGSMISVEADTDTALKLASDHKVEIACYNSRTSHVLVGDRSSIDAIEDATAAASIKSKKLNVTHGYHSVFTEPILPGLAKLAAALVWRKPTTLLETCSDGRSWEQIEPKLIAEHTRSPVYFVDAVERIADRLGPCTWLEAGSGSPITSMVRRALGSSHSSQHQFQAIQLGTSDAVGSLAESTVNLWRLGYKIQFFPFNRGQKQEYRNINLPPYQFEKTRHWLTYVDHAEVSPPPQAPAIVESEPSLLSLVKSQDRNAEFLVDPRSRQYKLFVGGHAVLANPLLPAPLYAELVFKAALTVCGQSSYVPSIEALEIQAPLGLDPSREITLSLNEVKGATRTWTFTVSSQARDKKTGSSTQHATGRVHLQPLTESSMLAEFARYESLIDHRRYEALVADADEAMQGSLVYKVFAKVVQYAEYYKGVKSVSSKAQEVIGHVVMPSHDIDALNDTVSDPLATDNFVQVAGLHVNSLKACGDNEVYVATKIDRIQHSPNFKVHGPATRSWVVYSNYRQSAEKEVINDIYVFDSAKKSLVLLILGARFTKVLISSLAKVLSRANANQTPGLNFSPNTSSAAGLSNSTPETVRNQRGALRDSDPKDAAAFAVEAPESKDAWTSSSSSSRSSSPDLATSTPSSVDSEENIHSDDSPLRLAALVADHLECDVAISRDSCLTDLGFDSLLGVELLSDIEKSFGVHIEMDQVTSELTFGDLSDLVLPKQSAKPKAKPEHIDGAPTAPTTSTSSPPSVTSVGSLKNTQQAFDEIRLGYESLAEETGFANFWSRVYPKQARLVVAYVVEAFAKLGCSLASMKPGDEIPSLKYHPKHKLLMAQLHEVLKDASIIASGPLKFVRGGADIDSTPSSTLYREIVKEFPQHASEHALLDVTGSKLGECLTDTMDPLQLLFRSKENRDLLEDVYTNGPMYAAVTKLLGSFLERAFDGTQGTIHILELGGGTGGTTKYVVDHLVRQNIQFTYTFTDISGSLVAAAKKKFAGRSSYMEFKVLDIEKNPPDDQLNRYHTIISTNCIHATKNLTESSTNIRKMLRSDGFLSLVEFTRNMFWFDLVFGLLDGWWFFNDGRPHVLANEAFWEKSMKAAGFKHVAWTSGSSPEANTLRIITGFQEEPVGEANVARVPPMETVTFKQVGELSLQADIYYPPASAISEYKRPVALMIHGGGHIMLSRKDVRPKQTQLLLDNGLLPISIDYRLCPEVNILEGPMVDVCDALRWARDTLPTLKLKCPGLQIDGDSVVVVGWSTGGTLAMTLAWVSAQQSVKPPEAILAFYCPTDYEDECWKTPNFPEESASSATSTSYDLLEGVQDQPITSYKIPANRNPIGGWMSPADPRSRIVLHMNWTGQALPVLLNGLPSKRQAVEAEAEAAGTAAAAAAAAAAAPATPTTTTTTKWHSLPQPPRSEIIRISPHAQILRGTYRTPTFLIHGTADDLIPWQQSARTFAALNSRGIPAGIHVLEEGVHLFDIQKDFMGGGSRSGSGSGSGMGGGSGSGMGGGERAVREGFEFLFSQLRATKRGGI